MNQAIITRFNNQELLLLYEENELAECHLIQRETTLQIGNIYIGRVEKVIKNIQSAFIRLDAENVGYLPLNDKPAFVLNRQLPKGLPSIAEGDSILVQVEQEPQKMKQAKVTGNICLSGNYVALDLLEGNLGVSKKIKDADRVKELKELIISYNKIRDNNSYGCVLRTACETAENDVILDEYRCLCVEMDTLLHRANYERKTGCIKSSKPEYISLLEEYGMNRLDGIKTDRKEILDALATYDIQGEFYDDAEYPLYKLLGLETEIKKLLSKKVWLKSGGFLVIEPTEAMVVIDVNTGKSIGGKNKDAHILKLNLEAAKEITRQLRLRNLSGIIMVDFINMKSDEDKQQVIKCLEQGLSRDKIPGYFVEITKLDVFELTRKKVRRPLHEMMKLEALYKNEK